MLQTLQLHEDMLIVKSLYEIDNVFLLNNT